MSTTIENRNWQLQMGAGDEWVLVLPRKDTAAITVAEWQQVLAPFWQEYRFLILDMPEKITQEQGPDAPFTVPELALAVQRELEAQNIVPKVIWGFSLGGMVAQELVALPGMGEIPLVLISTNAYADPMLQAVFSTWSLNLQAEGERGLKRNLLPWISKRSELPILTVEQPNGVSDFHPIAIGKGKNSLRAVAMHDARARLKQVSAPVLILFGAESVLLHEPQASVFRECLPHAQIHFIANSGMRILSDNQPEAVAVIKSFMEAYA